MNTSRHPAARWWAAPAVALLPALACALWFFPEDLHGWRTLGIVSAWAGSGMLLGNLLLMMRRPWLSKQLGGLEASYRWHHRSGVTAYGLLLLHPLALAFDAWLEAPHRAWALLAPWQQNWPVWLGWAALLLMMLGLATTFMLRLPYRNWRSLHLLLGLAVILGLAHIVVLFGEPLRIGVLLAIAALALAWRWLASDLGWAAYPYRVTQVEHLSSGMIEASLQPCASALQVTPGQFVLAAFGSNGNFHGCGEYHPFTVSAIAADGGLRLAIKGLGPCTQRIQGLQTGVIVRLQGPFGEFLAEAAQAPQLWVAGGIGITPFISALRTRRCSQPTTLLYLFKNAADAAFLEELQQFATLDPNFEFIPISTGQGHPDFAALLDRVRDLTRRAVRICGPVPMVAALLPHLQTHGIAAHAIHAERFDFR